MDFFFSKTVNPILLTLTDYGISNMISIISKYSSQTKPNQTSKAKNKKECYLSPINTIKTNQKQRQKKASILTRKTMYVYIVHKIYSN